MPTPGFLVECVLNQQIFFNYSKIFSVRAFTVKMMFILFFNFVILLTLSYQQQTPAIGAKESKSKCYDAFNRPQVGVLY